MLTPLLNKFPWVLKISPFLNAPAPNVLTIHYLPPGRVNFLKNQQIISPTFEILTDHPLPKIAPLI